MRRPPTCREPDGRASRGARRNAEAVAERREVFRGVSASRVGQPLGGPRHARTTQRDATFVDERLIVGVAGSLALASAHTTTLPAAADRKGGATCGRAARDGGP